MLSSVKYKLRGQCENVCRVAYVSPSNLLNVTCFVSSNTLSNVCSMTTIRIYSKHAHSSIISPLKLVTRRKLRKWVKKFQRGEMRNAYKIFVGNPEGKRPLGRLERLWEDNIGMDLGEVGSEGVDWMHLAQDRDQ